MSRVFSETIMLKIARMPKPATAMIMNRSTLRMPFSISMAASRPLLVFPGLDLIGSARKHVSRPFDDFLASRSP